MAGSGKTSFVSALYHHLTQKELKRVYTVNLDPAVLSCPYPVNINIKSTFDYKKIMKDYGLGPNGAIMTCLSLFAVKFDQVLNILESKSDIDYVILDTPGQIEVFNWSASGSIILEGLSISFPTIVAYVVDTVRSQKPVTFMSNMLYSCSVMYRCKLPFILIFNKIDVTDHLLCTKWMKDYDLFSDSVLSSDDSYMASLSRSSALALYEFYKDLKFVGVSSSVGTGMKSFLEKLDEASEEFETQYRKWISDRKEAIKKQREDETLQKWNEISNIFKSNNEKLSSDTQIPCIPEHLVEGHEGSSESEDLSDIDQIEQVMLNPKGKLNFI
ncbi:XPA binding protein 1 [Cryptosporidium ubiquitum]|uniref:GPN-loop GTPase n=1 Tax=Cryptosporidium ubiquitum TaxID=857276 RepID=A0A1J4MQS6_9CRYT|nr:XPA binding protein 1 [Cryptosporidium ubiquitum]OII75356.1 XPA binding protein 1 [Cryptosporidium ubiquitum]